MTDLYQCPDCGRHYRADKIAACPGCGDEVSQSTLTQRNQAKPRSQLSSQAREEDDDDDYVFIVAAQDRTTYAVRALALFLLTSASATLVGGIFYILNLRGTVNCGLDSNCYQGYANWVDLGPSIAALGVIAGVVIGAIELRTSRP